MYTAYFGLKEKPFSIAPDPQYLFMSDRHREALAHLTYGLGDAGGFVLLTGEVGTGKTTVSRCLMERLPENTQAAFILNPTLSSHELLATLCDELKIRYRKTGATLKTLTDKIQDKLLKNHKENTNTLLIIDEAQHLQPEVLEQLRLLTNLETNTKKLLQVILIGQPELQTLLKRRDLRQLAQRITARYHLLPLNKEEVAQYIKHRLSIAEGVRALFSVSAMHTIHKICGGIPRLINLVCERSLINAYSSNTAIVNKRMVLLSAYEALGDDYKITPWWQSHLSKMILLVLVIGIVSTSAYFLGTYQFKKNELTALINNNLHSNTKNKHNVEALKDESTILKNEAINTKATDLNTIEENSNNNNNSTDKISSDNKISNKDAIKDSQNSDKPDMQIKSSSENNNLAANQTMNKPNIEVKRNETQREPNSNSALDPINNNNSATTKDIELTQVEGVSNELLEQFKQALQLEEGSDSNKDSTSSNAPLDNHNEVESIDKMPLWVQNGVPQLQFEQHIYASDGKGWVKVNGRDRYEGDTIARELILVEILPQKVILNFRGEKFTMLALSTW